MPTDNSPMPPDCGPTNRSVIAEASARAGQTPARVSYLPRTNAVILAARVSYLHAALDDRRGTTARLHTFPGEPEPRPLVRAEPAALDVPGEADADEPPGGPGLPLK